MEPWAEVQRVGSAPYNATNLQSSDKHFRSVESGQQFQFQYADSLLKPHS
jgi:hypothetical protein